jgi:hypothetical protein
VPEGVEADPVADPGGESGGLQDAAEEVRVVEPLPPLGDEDEIFLPARVSLRNTQRVCAIVSVRRTHRFLPPSEGRYSRDGSGNRRAGGGAEVEVAPADILRLAEAEASLGEELVEEKWAQVSDALGELGEHGGKLGLGERLDLLAHPPPASERAGNRMRTPAAGFERMSPSSCAVARSAFTAASLSLIVFRLGAFRSRPVAAR